MASLKVLEEESASQVPNSTAKMMNNEKNNGNNLSTGANNGDILKSSQSPSRSQSQPSFHSNVFNQYVISTPCLEEIDSESDKSLN